MSLHHIHWFSRVLQKQVGLFAIVPDEGRPPFATFYLLHGLSDDYTIWQRRTRIEAYAARYPMIVVMPDGFRGFYTDNADGPPFATYAGEELPAFVERTLPAKRTRAGRCVGGLSMGGYGALRLGLGYPAHYASVTSHSGALMAPRRPEAHGGTIPEYRQIFGDRPANSAHDPVRLARQAKAAGPLPKIRIDCGTEDFLLDENRAFHRELDHLKVPHEYAEFPATHDWDYWDLHVQEALAFHAKAMRLRPIIPNEK